MMTARTAARRAPPATWTDHGVESGGDRRMSLEFLFGRADYLVRHRPHDGPVAPGAAAASADLARVCEGSEQRQQEARREPARQASNIGLGYDLHDVEARKTALRREPAEQAGRFRVGEPAEGGTRHGRRD